MPELPLLSLPAPETIDSPRRGAGGPRLIKPTRGRQAERLDPKFDRLARVVADPAQLMQLRQDPEAIAPERAVVFEVVGSLPTFYEEATRIGLEYLADDEIEIDPDEDFRLADKPDDPISGRLYLAMPDHGLEPPGRSSAAMRPPCAIRSSTPLLILSNAASGVSASTAAANGSPPVARNRWSSVTSIRMGIFIGSSPRLVTPTEITRFPVAGTGQGRQGRPGEQMFIFPKIASVCEAITKR